MPRGASSRGVRKAKAEAEAAAPEITFDERMTDEEREEIGAMLGVEVDEVQDPAVEAALENYAEAHRTADLAGEGAAMLNPDVPQEILAAKGHTDVDGERLVPIHARDFDWDTMRWAPPKSTGARPCLCNRIAGHECDLTTKSRFAIGHDARFKGVLQTAFRTGAKLRWAFDTGDVLTDPESGLGTKVEEPREEELSADQIARFAAPKLLPHVTHQSRGAKLLALDAEAGTTVPQTAVDAPAKADEELTDADLELVEDDDTDQRVAEEELSE
jgi:hypothetical protein